MAEIDADAILRNVKARREEWEQSRPLREERANREKRVEVAFEWVRSYEDEYFAGGCADDPDGQRFLLELATRLIIMGHVLTETHYVGRLDEIQDDINDEALAYTLAVVRKACEVGDPQEEVSRDLAVLRGDEKGAGELREALGPIPELVRLIMAAKGEPELRGFNGLFLMDLKDLILGRPTSAQRLGELLPQWGPPLLRVPLDCEKYVFARLPDGRYFLRFENEEDTLFGFKGLQLAEYVLKQSGTKAHLTDINAALTGNPSVGGRAGRHKLGTSEEDGPEGPTVLDEDNWLMDAYLAPDPADDETMEAAKEQARLLKEHIAEAKSLEDKSRGDADRKRWADTRNKRQAELEQIEGYIKTEMRKQRQQSKGQPADDSALEKLRGRWGENLKNAYSKLKDAGLNRLADYLERHIRYEGYSYQYMPDSAVRFSFNGPKK